ncbi:MAG: hypothetical protein R3A45_12375 [Bdellovibrionota bacterium]
MQPHIFGHAIEVRIYAEDPAQNFMPQPGTIHNITWPTGPGIRIDSGIQPGSEISLFYDPMIAKISVWDRDRIAAIARMKLALAETTIVGTKTNMTFLQDILFHPDYIDNNISTTFVKTTCRCLHTTNPPILNSLLLATLFSDGAQIHAKGGKHSHWWTSRLPQFGWYR